MYIVITGLPASGKTTLGKQLATQLDLDFLDKDDYLESLFEDRTAATEDNRQVLSRQSDRHFIADARASEAAVLVSHWRPPGLDTQSGTPLCWVDNPTTRVIQVHCRCSPEVAAQRFIHRRRHPGHADKLRSGDGVLQWMRNYATHLPLELGLLIEIDTHRNSNIDGVVEKIRAQLPA